MDRVRLRVFYQETVKHGTAPLSATGTLSANAKAAHKGTVPFTASASLNVASVVKASIPLAATGNLSPNAGIISSLVEAAGSGASSGSGAVWNNPGNITADDSSRATSTGNWVSSVFVSQVLQAANLGITSDQIPDDVILKGIEVRIQRQANTQTSSLPTDNSVRLLVNGTATGDNKAVAGRWATSETEIVYGGPNDLWGTSITPSDLRNSNTGLAFVANAGSSSGFQNASAGVDYIYFTIYYQNTRTKGESDLAATSSFTAIARLTRATDGNLTGTGILSATGKITAHGQSNFSGNGALTPTPTLLKKGQLNLSASGALNASAERILKATSNLSSTGSLNTTPGVISHNQSTFFSTSQLNSLAGIISLNNGNLTGTGQLNATATLIKKAQASLTANGSLSATPTTGALITGDASLSASGNCTFLAYLQANVVASLSAQSTLSIAAVRVIRSTTANMSGQGTLSGNARVIRHPARNV